MESSDQWIESGPPLYFVITDVRPSTEVAFFRPPTEYTQYMIDNYLNTGKYVTRPVEKMSQDQLTRHVMLQFRNQAAFDEFMSDTTLQQSLIVKADYCKAHGIQRSWQRSLGTIPASMLD
jgi:hypothetical protein